MSELVIYVAHREDKYGTETETILRSMGKEAGEGAQLL